MGPVIHLQTVTKYRIIQPFKKILKTYVFLLSRIYSKKCPKISHISTREQSSYDFFFFFFKKKSKTKWNFYGPKIEMSQLLNELQLKDHDENFLHHRTNPNPNLEFIFNHNMIEIELRRCIYYL
jgi:hypothetical protein